MSATRTSRHQMISFHALVILLVLCKRYQCAIEASVNVLTNASIESISPSDTECCTGAASAPSCSTATNSSRCPFDGDNTTVWTLSPNNQTITLTLRLQTPAALERLEVILGPSSTIPNSVTITAFNQDDNNDVSWTTYFNKTCQSNDPYLRKQGNRHYSCLNNQLWSSSLPHGLLSVRDINGTWLWWKTFQKLQVTVSSFGSNESSDQTAAAAIAIADVRLYGWNPPNSGCNCHPAGLLNVSKPCYDNGTCICQSPQPNNNQNQCIPSANFAILIPSTNIKYPNYGPVSGGTTVAMTGNFLSLLSDAIIGNISAKILSGKENTMILKTNAANESDIGNSLPIQLRFSKSNVFDSVVISDSEFTYKPNPNFTSITPRRTILSGGILLTVYGRNLDSIPYPFLVIVIKQTLDQGSQTTTYPGSGTEIKDISFCREIDSTTMKCPTPSLFGSSNYNAQKTTVSVFIPVDIISNSSVYTPCQPTNGQCIITVAPNPTIVEWNVPLDNPIGFPYYNGQRIMHIKGNGFQYGNNDGGDYKAEYTVKIDGVVCEIVAVIQNDITFYAPDPSSFGEPSKKQQVTLTIGNLVLTVGYVLYYRNWIDDPNNRNPLIGGLVGGIGGAIVLAIVVFLTVRYLRRRKRKDQLLNDPDYSYESVAPYFPEDIKKYSVDFERIEFEGELGKGNFGKVHKGKLANPDGSTTPVAIKTLHDGVRSFERKLEFLKEAMLMADFCHDHVLSLIAISIDKQKPHVILPLMEKGDLRGFVDNKDNPFTAGDLVSFSLQVAEGMEYLAKMKFVHCDLAARNCMINNRFLVKVADFGLARDIFEKDYYRSDSNAKPLPVKWMALECLQSSAVFTEKSDVWSYGVLVWELMTRGRRPYADVDNFEIKKYLESGRRLEKTDATPDFMYDLMQRCWLKESQLRPTFQEIVQELKTILSIAQSTEDESSSPRYIHNNVVEAARRSYLQLTADD